MTKSYFIDTGRCNSMGYGVNTIVNDLVNYGIVDFNTGMYVMGQTPVIDDHHHGSQLHDAPKLKPQPDKDEVIKENDSLTVVSNPKWKKVLFGVLAAAGLVFGGYKFPTKLIPFVKNGWNRLNPVQGLKNGWNKFVNFITKPFRKAPPTSAP